MCSEERVKCDKVTVHLKGEKEPMVVERVCWLAKSIFPGSREPALQIIDVPTGTVVSLFLCKSAGPIEKATAFCQVVSERDHSQPRQNRDGYF